MDVGAVVGVLLAYKDLPSPIKELIDWDQQRQDVQIKYEQVIDQFQPEGMLAEELQAVPDGPCRRSATSWSLSGVTVSEDGRVKQLDAVSLTLPTDAKMAVIGGSGRARKCWARCWRAWCRQRRLDQASTARTSSGCPSTCWARARPMSARRPTCSRCRCARTCCSA